MKNYKDYLNSSTDDTNSNLYIVFFKALALCFALSLVMLIIYALILSFTTMSDASMSRITQAIVIISITISGLYGGRKIKRKGWMFGLFLGLAFVILLIPVTIAFGQSFSFDKYFAAKMLMGAIVGLIGGVIGVNLS